MKKVHTKTKRTKQAKHVKVAHKHHKSYRKRHYIGLVAFLALAIALINSVVIYLNDNTIATRLASQTISDVFGRVDESNNATITSTYGFSLEYNQKKYSSSAIDGSTGDLHVGAELATKRAYDTIRLSAESVDTGENSSVKLNYYPNDKPATTILSELETSYIIDKQTKGAELVRANSVEKAYGGVNFQRTEWTRTLKVNDLSLETSFVTYTGLVDGSPMTVVVYEGLATNSSADSVMAGLSFTTRTQANVNLSASLAAKKASSLEILDSILGISKVGAETRDYAMSERISAAYGAAVVKVYNIAAGDLAIDGQVAIKNHLTGSTGSGFIVSSDGYIATNGHVAVIDARDEIVTIALQHFAQGNDGPLAILAQMSGLTQSELSGAKSANDALRIIIKKIYTLPESRFSFVNEKQNMLVGLGSQQVDIQELVKKTAARQDYQAQDSVKSATLKQADYGGTILPSVTQKFEKSDVALIKIDGDHYPMVTLGDMSSASQGSNLNIMGFPGIGSSNGLVSETKTASTLTTGKVSSQKEDTGGHNLIETDTEIGHGNSGGPAFNDDGEVIGIATYAIDTGGSGDGTLNYIRDINDFKNIAGKSSVNYELSDTQIEWNKGIEFFYNARYKKAVASFAKVKELYPEHPRVAELTATADKRIANGENVDDFPVLIVSIIGLIAVGGIAGSVIFILSHRKKHHALVQAVATGQAQPTAPGAPAQKVPSAVPNTQFIASQQSPFPQANVDANAPVQTPSPFAPQPSPTAEPTTVPSAASEAPSSPENDDNKRIPIQ